MYTIFDLLNVQGVTVWQRAKAKLMQVCYVVSIWAINNHPGKIVIIRVSVFILFKDSQSIAISFDFP